eukprot:TRINITY_DN46858_c0_g1_i1.p2 TRINITY_DN46858_c0_g1~~TRINITY_DN46858_c0_g1_i1.p2  ORF type:complete len:115 (+),score=12.07 TRINITY_DN46858_c0_g1_i1:52-345(+)
MRGDQLGRHASEEDKKEVQSMKVNTKSAVKIWEAQQANKDVKGPFAIPKARTQPAVAQEIRVCTGSPSGSPDKTATEPESQEQTQGPATTDTEATST